MSSPDLQQFATTEAERTIIHLLLQTQAGLADVALIALRIEDKLDELLDAMDEEAGAEEADELRPVTLDGEPMGAERKEGTPL